MSYLNWIEEEIVRNLEHNDFVIFTYNLSSEFKKSIQEDKDSKKIKNIIVKRRIAFLKILNLTGIKIGTSLYAIRVKDLNKFLEKIIDIYYKEEIYQVSLNYYILGKMDKNVLKQILLNNISNLYRDIEKELNIDVEDIEKTKKILRRIKPKIDILKKRLLDYKHLTGNTYHSQEGVLKLINKRTKILNNLRYLKN